MSKAALLDRPTTTEAAALTKATVRAAQQLGLTNRVLATIVGLSEPTISRMTKNEFALRPGDKAFELSILFVRLFRSLDAIVGGDMQVARAWLDNPNTALRDAPINLIRTVNGLVNVVQYLDTRRARI
ncbi:MAG: antitoxin Xre/MbcA/ParS toxin-binding domain-containing protein [Pseudolabrys sp.]